ncbi:hypothetical protein WDW86_17925 [Bdellovibrionota bacterium FG-2]
MNQNGGAFFTLGGLDIPRNIPMGNNLMMRVTVLGVLGNFSKDVFQNFKFFLNGSIDMMAIGFHKVANEIKSGVGMGGQFEVGAVIAKYFRIVFGEKLDMVESVDSSRYVDTTCDSVYVDSYIDEYGYEEGGYWTESCTDNYKTVTGDLSFQSKTYLDLTYDISKNFAVFASPNFVVYMRDTTREEVTFTDKSLAFQVLFGVSGKW